MAKLERIPNQPGRYAFKCECGYDKRQVTDSERFFSCERPVDAKAPGCKLTFGLTSLVEQMERDERKQAAEKFLADNEKKVAEAKAVLGLKAEPAAAISSAPAVTSTQSDVETKKLEKPKKVKKEKPNG